jgi:hypothetical protein
MFLDSCHQYIIHLYLTQIKPIITNYQTKFKNNKYCQWIENISVNIYTQIIYLGLYGYTKCQIFYHNYLNTSHKTHTVWLGDADYLENTKENKPPQLNYHPFLTDNPEIDINRQLIYKKNGITGILLPSNNKIDINLRTSFDFKNECLSANLITNDNEVDITNVFNNYARVKQNKQLKLNIYYLVDNKGNNIVKQSDTKITIIDCNAKKITYTDIITF